MTLVYQSAGTAVAASGASPTTIATTVALAVGDALFIAMAYDNSGGGGADPMSGTFTPTPATGTMGFLGGSGQTGLNDPGAASAGLCTRVNAYNVTTAIPQGTNMSIAWSGTVVVRAVAMVKVSSNAGMTVNYRTNSGTNGTNVVASTAPALTTPSVNNGELVLCYAGHEYGAAPGADADTTNGTWGSAVVASTGSTTSGMAVIVQGKVVTATATQAFNPTGTSSDWILGALIFREVAPPNQGSATVVHAWATAATGAQPITVNEGSASVAWSTSFSGGAPPPIDMRQAVTNRASSGNYQLVLPTPVVADNYLVVTGASYQGSFGQPTDSRGHVYTEAGSQAQAADAYLRTWYIKVTNPGACTITTASPQGGSATAAEFTNLAAAGVLSDADNTTGTGTTFNGAATGTLPQDNCLIVGNCTHMDGQTIALTEDIADGFALMGEEENNSNYQAHNAQWKATTSPASITPNWTKAGVSEAWCTQRFVFLGTAAGGSQAIGQRTPKGAATTTHTWGVSAVGPAPSPNQGSATVTWTEATPAVGRKVPKATTSAAWTETLTAAGKKTPKATTTVSWTEVAVAAGKRASKAAATSTWAETLAAVGKETPKSSITTSHSWVCAAAGITPPVGAKQGSAIVTWTEATTAAGKRVPEASGAVTWTETTSAIGKKVLRGTATTTWTETTTAAGKRTPKGTTTTSYVEAVTSVGRRTPKATSIAVHSWTLFAQGVTPIVGVNKGSALVLHAWAPAAVGRRTPKGGNAITFLWTTSATGRRVQRGAVTTSFLWATGAVGKRVPKSTVTASYLVTMTASGLIVAKAYVDIQWIETLEALGRSTPLALPPIPPYKPKPPPRITNRYVTAADAYKMRHPEEQNYVIHMSTYVPEPNPYTDRRWKAREAARKRRGITSVPAGKTAEEVGRVGQDIDWRWIGTKGD